MRTLVVLALAALAATQLGGCPYLEFPTSTLATIETSEGTIVVELYPEYAPIPDENFRTYAESDFYDGTILHHVIPGFVVQGGGFTADLAAKTTNDPIVSEADNGLLNMRGTIAMARTELPDTATAQFFFNVADNPELDSSDTELGYAVFGVVREGMDVIGRIAAVDTETRGEFEDVPVSTITITDVAIANTVSDQLELTPLGETYATSAEYGILSAIRQFIVSLVGYTIFPA